MLEAQNETMYPWMKCFTSLVVDFKVEDLRTYGYLVRLYGFKTCQGNLDPSEQ